MKQLYVFVFLFFIAVNTNAQTDTKEKLVKEMLELSGANKMALKSMEIMVASYKKHMETVPQEFWDEFIKEANTEELVNMLAPIYAKHYTESDLKELIAFYKSPIGQKLVEKLPLISQESFTIGEAWGKKLGEKVAAKLKTSGYLQ